MDLVLYLVYVTMVICKAETARLVQWYLESEWELILALSDHVIFALFSSGCIDIECIPKLE